MTILDARNLKTYFPVKGGIFHNVKQYLKAVNDVSVYVNSAEIVSVVGESGCGKTTLGMSLLGLIPVTSGDIFLDGVKIKIDDPDSWKPFRKDFQIIFQDPFTSLNPRHTVYKILSEPLLLHKIHTRKDIKEGVAQLLAQVGLSQEYMDRFPHAFSGGQRQRISIARSIGVQPKLIVCDEVVSALDVSVQAQIIQLLLELREKMNVALLFITHDLSLVKVISDRVYVMYLGRVVEQADSKALFRSPAHPYTQALMSAIPQIDPSLRANRTVLKGEVPSIMNPPGGCPFHPRCPIAEERCQREEIPFYEVGEGHLARCWKAVGARPIQLD
jgi:oligopeptide/dipeptide ABC transporter ATP-binding protein